MRSGPSSKSIFSITAYDSAVYIGLENGGVYRSSNDGDSWSAVGLGLSRKSVQSIAMQDGTILVTTVMQGVYQLKAGDSYWLGKNEGVPADTRVLISVGSRVLLGAQSDGIYYTDILKITEITGYRVITMKSHSTRPSSNRKDPRYLRARIGTGPLVQTQGS